MFIAAAASSVETYGGEGGKIVHETSTGLPMTGFEWGLLAGIAVILFIAGIAMARMARPE